MSNRFYYVLDATHLYYLNDLIACSNECGKVCPNNRLSITYSNDLALSIVKVISKNKIKLQSMIDYHVNTNKPLIDKMITDPLWQSDKMTDQQKNDMINKILSDNTLLIQ